MALVNYTYYDYKALKIRPRALERLKMDYILTLIIDKVSF